MLCCGLNQYVISGFVTAVIITHYYRPLHYHITRCLISHEQSCHESLSFSTNICRHKIWILSDFRFFFLITNCWISVGKVTNLIHLIPDLF